MGLGDDDDDVIIVAVKLQDHRVQTHKGSGSTEHFFSETHTDF